MPKRRFQAKPGVIAIRPAVEADLPRIVELLLELSLDDPREDLGPPLPTAYRDTFREIQADPRQQLVVLEADGQVIGTLTLIVVPHLSYRGRPFAVVESVVVDAGARSAGYGEQLMRYAIAEARRAGCHRISLTSNKRRSDAHRFYERLGFHATHEGFKLEL